MKSTAPAFMARTVVVTSVWPLTTIKGSSTPTAGVDPEVGSPPFPASHRAVGISQSLAARRRGKAAAKASARAGRPLWVEPDRPHRRRAPRCAHGPSAARRKRGRVASPGSDARKEPDDYWRVTFQIDGLNAAKGACRRAFNLLGRRPRLPSQTPFLARRRRPEVLSSQ